MYAYEKFPSAELIGKVDDDFFADSKKLYARLEEVTDPLLYYGWAHPFHPPAGLTNTKAGRSREHFLGDNGIFNDIDSTLTSLAICGTVGEKVKKSP